jgi:hypothetical protein
MWLLPNSVMALGIHGFQRSARYFVKQSPERVKKVNHDPGLMTWQVQQGLSRFALPIAFSASSHHEPSTHPMAKHVARATNHLYIPIPLGSHRKHERNCGMDDRKTLTIIRTNSAPFGLDVGPPVFCLDKCPSRFEWKCEIAAVTV